MAEKAQPKVKYVTSEEIIKEVSYERIILPRYKIQITDKFLFSIQEMFTMQNTYIVPKVEAYGIVTKLVTATDDGDFYFIFLYFKRAHTLTTHNPSTGNIEIRDEVVSAKGKAKVKGPIDRVIVSGHTRSIRRICVWQGDGSCCIMVKLLLWFLLTVFIC
jgi:hypothetical protein